MKMKTLCALVLIGKSYDITCSGFDTCPFDGYTSLPDQSFRSFKCWVHGRRFRDLINMVNAESFKFIDAAEEPSQEWKKCVNELTNW